MVPAPYATQRLGFHRGWCGSGQEESLETLTAPPPQPNWSFWAERRSPLHLPPACPVVGPLAQAWP